MENPQTPRRRRSEMYHHDPSPAEDPGAALQSSAATVPGTVAPAPEISQKPNGFTSPAPAPVSPQPAVQRMEPKPAVSPRRTLNAESSVYTTPAVQAAKPAARVVREPFAPMAESAQTPNGFRQASQSTPPQPRSQPRGYGTAPVPPPAPVREKVTRERPPKVVRKQEAEPLPRWLPTSMICSILLIVALLTAGWLMQGYLQRQEQARQQAHKALLDSHPLSYTDLIEKYAIENNLEPAYVAAIILNESSYRTNAESNVGARGLMQLMENTAGWIADKLNVSGYSFEMLWDAETNIRFGCWYLGWLSNLFGGDPVSVTAAYHAGQNQVTAWLADSGISPDGLTLTIDRMPEGNTKIYAERVTQAYAIYDALYYHRLNPLPADASAPDTGSIGNERGGQPYTGYTVYQDS